MKPTAAILTAALAASALAPRAAAQFVDVPPCHWAAEAVNRLAAGGVVQGAPSPGPQLATNALRQVFEGLKCGDAAWTARFLTGAPAALAASVAARPVRDFELTVLETRAAANAATIRYRVTVTPPDAARATTVTGTARATFDAEAGWRVEYASLLESGLAFLPR